MPGGSVYRLEAVTRAKAAAGTSTSALGVAQFEHRSSNAGAKDGNPVAAVVHLGRAALAAPNATGVVETPS